MSHSRNFGELRGPRGISQQGKVSAYNDLVSRFRQRITLAVNSMTEGQPYEPELTDELQLIAKSLPEARRVAETAKREQQVTTE